MKATDLRVMSKKRIHVMQRIRIMQKAEEHGQSKLVAKPVVKLPTAESFGLTEAKEERLSEIIAEINSRTGKSYDNDVAVKAMLQIRDILMKSDKLKTSAKNNTLSRALPASARRAWTPFARRSRN